jgi:hypothetical protein
MNENNRKKLAKAIANWESNLTMGNEYTTTEIRKIGNANDFIYPSDHAYNKTNKGNLSNMREGDSHVFDTPDNVPLFECVKHGVYKYLGKDYPYNGECRHKPRGGTETEYGIWNNGVFTKY